jgi:hypothetical protein
MKSFELRNTLAAPAPDDALIEALLAFANGRNVVIWGQEKPFERVDAWSRWRAVPAPDERDFLQGLIEDPWGGMASRTDQAGRRRPTNAVIQLPALLAPDRDRALLPTKDPQGWLAHMRESLERELVLVGRRQGYSLADFRSFRNVASALAFAMLLVMDQTKPYANTLCRCKLPRCRSFYLARKNPKGGPANRTYCDPTHRDEHHNSAQRKPK